jgi:hypothetical protein
MKCRSELLAESNVQELESNRVIALKNADKYTDLLLDCSNHGTCDVLAAHHEILEHDTERLTTEFLVKMICNKDYKPGSVTKVGVRKGRGRPRA